MGSETGMAIFLSNCAELHSWDLENRAGKKSRASQGDCLYFHFSSVNDGSY